jgi:hypothetical protein
LFSVARFTARALPLNEQVSSRCKALTLPQPLSGDALMIRASSRSTFCSHRFQSIWSQGATAAEDALALSLFICDFLIRWFCLLFAEKLPLPIRPIPERPSLFPASSPRKPVGGSCEALSPISREASRGSDVQVNRLLYLLASACERLWLVHANDACGLTAISIACAEDIVSTASDPIVTNHAGADRLLRTEPQVRFMMN